MKKEYIIYKLSDAVNDTCKIDNELVYKVQCKTGTPEMKMETGVLVGLTRLVSSRI